MYRSSLVAAFRYLPRYLWTIDLYDAIGRLCCRLFPLKIRRACVCEA